MNAFETKISVSSNSYNASHKTRRKYKPKRRRNRYKSNHMKKKIQKTFQEMYESRPRKLDSRKLNCKKVFHRPNFSNITSNWYWSNYMKAMDWQNNYSAAQWKTYALGLQVENRYLAQVIRNHLPNFFLELPFTKQNLISSVRVNKSVYNSPKMSNAQRGSSDANLAFEGNNGNGTCTFHDNAQTVDCENDKFDFEFEMSEEMIKFFEQSFKHKLSLKKNKEELDQQEILDKKVKEVQENKAKRCLEMKFLYGDDSSKIIGMETAIQLSFDKYCDTKSPIYWPNIPFRL